MNLNINDFEGPLDLLLHLVKTSKMDIYEIDIKLIIDKYLEFINTIDKNDLDASSEYLVMASELIHLKSKLLLNIQEEYNEDEYLINSEEELRDRIILYEQYKKVTDSLKELEENRKNYFTKIPEDIKDYQENIKMDNNLCLDDLFNAMIELQKREEYQKPLNTKIMRKELSVEDKTKYIKKILPKGEKIEFSKLFITFSKEEVIVTFLAILNMAKENELVLFQKNNFENIFIERR